MSNNVKVTLTYQEAIDLMGFMLELGMVCATLAKDQEAPTRVRLGMLQRLECIVSVIADMGEEPTLDIDDELQTTVSHTISFESFSNLIELLTEIDSARDAMSKEIGIDLPNPKVGPMDRAYRARVVSKLQTAEKVN